MKPINIYFILFFIGVVISKHSSAEALPIESPQVYNVTLAYDGHVSCVGNFINPNFIVVPVKCVADKTEQATVNVSFYSDSQGELNFQEYPVSSLIKTGDIAMVQLGEPIDSDGMVNSYQSILMMQHDAQDYFIANQPKNFKFLKYKRGDVTYRQYGWCAIPEFMEQVSFTVVDSHSRDLKFYLNKAGERGWPKQNSVDFSSLAGHFRVIQRMNGEGKYEYKHFMIEMHEDDGEGLLLRVSYTLKPDAKDIEMPAIPCHLYGGEHDDYASPYVINR